MNEEEEDLVNRALGQITIPQPAANTQQPTQPAVQQPAVQQPTQPAVQQPAVQQPAVQPTGDDALTPGQRERAVEKRQQPAAVGNNPPPPPRTPSEAQRYNSAARTADTTVAMYNPRGLGNQSKYKQSQGNVVPGSLQAKIEAERAIGKSDPWTGWNVKRNETRPVLHSMKGADGTTYYQQIDGKAGTARYWSVDSSGNRTEYTGDDKVSARDQINAARKNADLEAKKNYWRSRGVQFGETDEKGNFTGKFENLTAEGARAEYERKFGDAERAVREGNLPKGMTPEQAQEALDQARLAWSRSGEGREQYNWKDKLDQSGKVDWDAVYRETPKGQAELAAASAMTPGERQRRWNANNLSARGATRDTMTPGERQRRQNANNLTSTGSTREELATASAMTPGERQRRWNANNLTARGATRGEELASASKMTEQERRRRRNWRGDVRAGYDAAGIRTMNDLFGI